MPRPRNEPAGRKPKSKSRRGHPFISNVDPNGAWGLHETLIPQEPKKPIRMFISVGDKDLLNPNVMRDEMHDWVEANHRMAKVLKDNI